MSIPALNFPLFPKLPAELREEIWRYCLPRRVCELDQPVDNIVLWERNNIDGPWQCELRHTTYMNGRLPLISRVCRESRCVAFKAGGILPDFPSGRPREAQWHSRLDADIAWQDRARVSAHLNWSSACEVEYAYSGSPLHGLAWDASHVSGGGSLMIKYLDNSFGDPSPFDLGLPRVGPPIIMPLSPDKLRDLEALKQLSNWLVVMRVIVVHSDLKPAAATDLFGLLGDARVQIVDVSEEARVETFFDLAETCERKDPVTIRQDFRRESADSMKQKLRAVVMKQFRSKELAAAMRPAIMFRLCTRMCNHVGHEHGRGGSGHSRGRSGYNRGRSGRGR